MADNIGSLYDLVRQAAYYKSGGRPEGSQDLVDKLGVTTGIIDKTISDVLAIKKAKLERVAAEQQNKLGGLKIGQAEYESSPEQRDLAKRKEEAGIGETIAKKGYYESFTGGQQTQALQAGEVERGARIVPHAQLPGNKPLSAETAKVVENANSGTAAIDEMLRLIDKNPFVYRYAGVPGARALNAVRGDEDAQRYIRAKLEATDVLTRLRTGAALNVNEQAFYDKLVNDIFRSPQVAKESLIKVRSLFENLKSTSRGGTRDISQPNAGQTKSGLKYKVIP